MTYLLIILNSQWIQDLELLEFNKMRRCKRFCSNLFLYYKHFMNLCYAIQYFENKSCSSMKLISKIQTRRRGF